jgi:hypothetical protein
MYIVVNTDGTLTAVDEPANATAIRRAVGDPGFDMFALGDVFEAVDGRSPSRYVFVNDEGFRLGLPRNPLGALLVANFGSPVRILAGPVVITGWEHPSATSEIRDLTPDHVAELTSRHADLARAVAGEWLGEDDWSEVIREQADYVRNAPAPTLEFVPLDEYLSRLDDKEADR